MATRQYIGARYVPQVMGEWDKNIGYEALSIVTYLNTSYTSKKPVPVGIEINNTEYWVSTGNYNAQISELSNKIDNLTIMDLTDDSIVFPSDNPMGNDREQIIIRVPENVNKFVDNVIGIQNKSHGRIGKMDNAYGNAAIAFFDYNQVERGAIGYSREQSIQPNGYVANTLYLEIGNPFGDKNTDTDFRVIATNSSGFENSRFYPIEAISKTGILNLRARGDEQINLYGGSIFRNNNSEYGNICIAPYLAADRIGIIYNNKGGERYNPFNSEKMTMGVTIGGGYDYRNYPSMFATDGLAITVQSQDDFKTLLTIDKDGKTYLGHEQRYKSYAFNGMFNVSNADETPSLCAKQENPRKPTAVLWNIESQKFLEFQYGDTITDETLKGSITYNTVSGQIAYNTTSDYRIKTISGNAENSLEKIMNLKVYNGFVGNATNESAFCLAHELQEVLPYCVSGNKDEVDENGNAILQQVDYSKIIPILIKGMQDLVMEVRNGK